MQTTTTTTTNSGDRRGVGRPPKTESARQSVAITVWVTPADGRLIRTAAAKRGESLSAFLAAGGRARAGQPIEETRSEASAALRRLLAPIGSNLNQGTRAINIALKRSDDAGVVAALEAHRETFRDLGAALLDLAARR